MLRWRLRPCSPGQLIKPEQITIPGLDDAALVRFWVTRDLRLVIDRGPDYARLETKAGTMLCLHRTRPESARGSTVVYFAADAVDATVFALQAAGIVFDTEPEGE